MILRGVISSVRRAATVLQFDAIRRYRGFQPLTIPVALVMWAFIAFRTVQPGGQGALYFGEQFLVGNSTVVREAIVKTIVGGVLLIAVATAFDTVNGEGELSDGDKGVLYRLTVTQYLIRLTLKNIGSKMFVFSPPIIISAGAFYYASGSLVTSLSLLLTTLVLIPFGVSLGYSVGLIGLSVSRAADLEAEQETVLGFGVVVLLAMFIINWNPLANSLMATPARAIGLLTLNFIPPFEAGLRASVLGGTLLLTTVVASFAVSTRVADRIWLGDTITDNNEAEDESNAEPPLDKLPLERILSRRTTAIVRSTWRVAARSPVTLVYAVPPLVIPLLLLIDPTVSSGGFAHAIGALSVGAAAGNAVNLNIIDREGVALPWILTAPVTAREYVTVKVLAVGVPMAVVAFTMTVGLSVVVGASAVEAAAVVTLGCVYAVIAPAVAILFGVVVTDQSDGAVVSSGSSPPKSTTLVMYNVCQLFVCLPVFSVVSVETLGAVLLNTAVGVAVAGTAGYAAFLYARRELDKLVLPLDDRDAFQL